MAAAVGDVASDSEEFSAGAKGVPCLFSFRCLPGSSAYGAVAVSLCPRNDGPPPPGAVVFQNRIPKHLKGIYLINTLDDYIVIDDYRAHKGIRLKLVDPFSPSWPVLACFPRRCRYPGMDDHVFKVVAALPFTRGSVAVAVVGLFCPRLVCTTQGADCWTAREDLTRCGAFQDLIFRKQDGLFYALTKPADKVFSLGFSVDDADGRIDDVSIQPFNLEAIGDAVAEAASRGRCLFQEARLVDSPSGLFVVRWRMTLTWKREEKKERAVDVYKFAPEEKAWAPVKSLDGYSFLIDCRQSLALSTADFPHLPSNRIYISCDAALEMEPGLVNVGRYYDDLEYNLIYDLGSGSWEQWEPLYGPQDMSSGMTMWMMLPSSGMN